MCLTHNVHKYLIQGWVYIWEGYVCLRNYMKLLSMYFHYFVHPL